jgi:hypothetical protein
VLVRITLGDGFGDDTLSSGVSGNQGWSTLGDGVQVVGSVGLPGWSTGRRISRSFWIAWDHEMDSLVEDRMVLLRAVRVSIAWGGSLVSCSRSLAWHSALGKVTGVGHVMSPGTRHRITGTNNDLMLVQCSMQRYRAGPIWLGLPDLCTLILWYTMVPAVFCCNQISVDFLIARFCCIPLGELQEV